MDIQKLLTDKQSKLSQLSALFNKSQAQLEALNAEMLMVQGEMRVLAELIKSTAPPIEDKAEKKEN